MIDLLLCLLVLPLLVPSFALLALTLAALRGRREQAAEGASVAAVRPRMAVLVPAHNESVHLLPTLARLREELNAKDRLLVVADNCSDDTAALARGAGAEVIERHNLVLRGKGYALAHGVDHLRADPPQVVLVVDADCLPDAGSIDTLVRACHQQARPVQMLNLMSAPAGAGLRIRVLEFAMVMKNWVRPLGTQQFGGVCHLMGTGMALPWQHMAQANLATGHVAEDMLLGVALTRAGAGPVFVPQARIRSSFVSDAEVARTQKTRWEHGHLDTLRHELPGMVADAVRQRSRSMAALALDLCIPPVALYFSLLVALLFAVAIAAGVWPDARSAAALVGLGAAAFVLAIGLGWWFFGRHLLQASELLRLPLYAVWKLPVYVAYVLGRRSAWLRTQRTTEVASKSEASAS